MLVGRDGQAAELARLLAEDRPTVLVGEAGIGKTTLMRHVAAASGRPVVEGGALSTLSWMEHLAFERALGRPVRSGDATAVASDVSDAVGAGVLVLDDLQWAHLATLDVVGLLAGRVGMLVAVRRGDARSDSTLDRLRSAGFTELSLDGLTDTHAAAVVRGRRPDLPEATVARVVARTGGNPLLLHELTATGEPTDSLRLAIAARLRQLDAVGHDVFAMLALAGRPLPVTALDDAGVKSLLAADLVVVDEHRVGARHALLAEVVVDQLDADERRTLHARLARLIVEGDGDDGEAARHFALAGERDAAFDAAMRAAAATARPGEQAAHLAIAAECATGAAADELRLRAAHALERVHDWTAMVRVLDLLAPDNREAQATACLLRARGAWTAGDNDGLRHSLVAGLELVAGTGSDTEVRLRIEQSRVPIFIDVDVAEGVRATSAALRLARSTGVDVHRAEYLHGTALAVADQPGGDAHLRSAIEAARACGDTSTEFLAANNLVSYHESTSDPQAGRALCREFIARAHELGLGEWEQLFRCALTLLEFHAGEYEHVIETAEGLLDDVRETRGRDGLIEVLCLALVDVGRIDEALRRCGDGSVFSKDYRGTIQSGWVRTEAALWGGRPAVALEATERCLALEEEDPNLEFFHVSRAWALFDLGRDPGPPAAPHPRPMLWAVKHETAGIGLLARGDHNAAAAAFAEAASLWAPFHLRGELRCLWAAGEATRRAGSQQRAVELLEAVEARVQQHGMLPLLSRVHRSLRAAGVRRSAPRTRTAGDLLSGRQREVLRLVGDGLTNAEIAQRLGVSRHTVVSQIGSAVAKLGATGRTHAASVAVAGTS